MQRPWLTSSAVFLSGGLLLTLELLVARALLPMVGGSALAWTTVVAFFQVLLLAGSLYAHLTARLGVRRQVLIHAGVVLAALAMLPLRFTVPGAAFLDHPVISLVQVLATSVGLPCFILCTTSSLVQQWLSGQQAARAYAASNAGSLLGLISYPFCIEPLLGLSTQSLVWTVGFVVLAAVLGLLMVQVTGRRGGATWQPPALQPPSPGTARKWFVLAFVPCSLLLGVTSHMTNELPSFPLLWVVPLALYLLTLVIAFAARPGRWMQRCLAMEPVFMGVMAIMMFVPVRTSGFLIHLTAVFVASLTLHGRLALVEPEADRGAFVLWTCAGGATAGLFHAAVAPLLFPFVAEFPLAVVAACLLRPETPVRRQQRWAATRDFLQPAVLAAALLAIMMNLPRIDEEQDIVGRLAILFIGAGIVVIFRRRPLRYGLGMAAVLASGFWTFQWDKTELLARSAYGVSRVVHDKIGKQTLLFHGTTIHGAQGDQTASSRTPRFYFRPDGPLGRMLLTGAGQQNSHQLAIVGLGAGSLAWYVQPGQRMKFYEIDPVVEKIARDSRWFTYLTSAKGEVDVSLGDGRLALAAEPDSSFDVIILDAFSSDSVPTHLVTREALEIYLRKLTPHGIMVFNTSNRHIDVAAVVVSVARSLGLQVRVTHPPAAGAPNRSAAMELGTWAVVTRNATDFGDWLSGDDRWVTAGETRVTAWTDDLAGVLSVLRW